MASFAHDLNIGMKRVQTFTQTGVKFSVQTAGTWVDLEHQVNLC